MIWWKMSRNLHKRSEFHAAHQPIFLDWPWAMRNKSMDGVDRSFFRLLGSSKVVEKRSDNYLVGKHCKEPRLILNSIYKRAPDPRPSPTNCIGIQGFCRSSEYYLKLSFMSLLLACIRADMGYFATRLAGASNPRLRSSWTFSSWKPGRVYDLKK